MARAPSMHFGEGETPAIIALGSNLGDRAAIISGALRDLSAISRTRLLAVSSVIETQPVGPQDQGPYLNAAALLATSLEPADLLDALLGIEARHGRVRDAGRRWGPRTLDLDLILYGDQVIDEPGLRVPHPRMHERLFVLLPVAEIAPDMPVPQTGATISRLLDRLKQESKP